MRRLRLAALLAVLGAGVAAPTGVLAGSHGEQAMSSGSSRAAGTATAVTFTLQQATDKQCKALSPPARVLGKGCVDDTGMVVQEAWSVNDGNARRATEQYETSYQWKIPPTIKAGGSITLLVRGQDKQGALHCPALAVAGDFARAQIYKCAEGGATLNESLKVTLAPPSGDTAKLMIWVTDGPDYTYFYRAGETQTTVTPRPNRPKCRTLSGVEGPGSASGPAAVCVPVPISSSACYSTFLGLKDRPPTDDPFPEAWRTKMGVRLARTAIDYPGVTIEADIPGEGSSGAHSPALLIPGNDLNALLVQSKPPTQLFQTGNVYARVTPRFEVVLRQKILTSRGNLMPADVMRLALDSVKQVSGAASYPLAVLTAHNLMKNAAMIGRAAIQDANALHLPKNPSQQLIAHYNGKVAKEEQALCKWSPLVAKLASLRLDPAASKDKIGPWYHAFGILSAGALINGDKARLAALAEHAGKSLKIFSNEGGFNAEKFALDKEFAATAVHISREGLRRFQ